MRKNQVSSLPLQGRDPSTNGDDAQGIVPGLARKLATRCMETHSNTSLWLVQRKLYQFSVSGKARVSLRLQARLDHGQKRGDAPQERSMEEAKMLKVLVK